MGTDLGGLRPPTTADRAHKEEDPNFVLLLWVGDIYSKSLLFRRTTYERSKIIVSLCIFNFLNVVFNFIIS